jgi:hypothetical protein
MAGICDTSDWPNKELDCGTCKVLVDDFDDAWQLSCDAYCNSVGRVCVGAAEEDGDSCTEESTQGCSAEDWLAAGSTSDALCECGAASVGHNGNTHTTVSMSHEHSHAMVSR